MIEYVITITIILTILSVGLFHCKNLLVHNNSFWDKKIIIHSSVIFWIVQQRYIFPKNWSYETQNRKEKGLWFFSSWTNWFTVLAIMPQCSTTPLSKILTSYYHVHVIIFDVAYYHIKIRSCFYNKTEDVITTDCIMYLAHVIYCFDMTFICLFFVSDQTTHFNYLNNLLDMIKS